MGHSKSRNLPPGLAKLHPIEAFGHAPARAGEIRIEQLERRLSPKVPFPHMHDFYHIVYIEAGSGWHEIDFRRYKIRPKQIFVMRPGQVHSWQLSPRTRGLVLEFTQGSLERNERNEAVLAGLELVPSVVKAPDTSSMAGLLTLMSDEFRQGRPGYRLVLEQILVALLLQLGRQGAQVEASTSRTQDFSRKFRELVERYFQEHHAVEFYAEKLGITAKALTTRVSKSLGKSAGMVVQERLLIEAKRLLTYTDLSVAEIGYRLGYDDPNYFTRFFKQRAGLTPGKFRALATQRVPH